jgi:tripartite-type tricarboxylate transporter receptor subunit TctC
MRRRPFAPVAIICALAGALTFTLAAHAQNYPDHLIKMIHGFPPGGNVDVIARLMAQEMSKGLGQPILVEPKPGGVGVFAADLVARAEPDGYTLLTLPSAHAVTGAISKLVKYNVVDDFAWLSTVSFYPFILCVRKDSPIASLSDLIARARSKPQSLSYGSSGPGTIQHMTAELVASSTNVKFLHVPYRGEALAMTGLLSGDIDFVITTTTVAAEQVRAGNVRALGVTSRTRWKDLPDVPTFDEAGAPGVEVVSWTGIAATPNTPKPIVARLHAEIQRALAVPEVKTQLESFGGEPRGTSPEEMRKLVDGQLAMWRAVARTTGIQLEQ